MNARKPFVYLAVVAVFLGVIGLLILSQDLSGRTVLSHADTYSASIISSHNSLGDCWIVASNNVYDVTLFSSIYPEYSSLRENCGKDAGSQVAGLPAEVKEILSSYQIGVLA